MCDAVNNIKPENSDAMISMIVAGDNIRLSSGGEIAGCKKYEANCPIKLQPGFFPFEFRVPAGAGDNSQRRAYGVCDAKRKKLYMMQLYTKNAGQNQADKNFDEFMIKAKKYIRDVILAKTEMYNNIRKHDMISKHDFLAYYEELSEMSKDLGLNSFIEGYKAAIDGELLEGNESAEFKNGYELGLSKKENAIEFYKNNPERLHLDCLEYRRKHSK